MIPPEPSAAERTDIEMPGGRVVSLSTRPGLEELQILSPDGNLELRVVFGPDGPVVGLRCARLVLSSPDTISVDCRRFEVRTTDAVDIAGAELRAVTSGDIRLNGDRVLLNCTSPGEEPPEETP
jgi:hypothetical protein